MQRITFLEREKLEFLVRCRLGIRDIARRLHRDHTVILRELERNTARGDRYTAKAAERCVQQRRQRSRLRKLDRDDRLYWLVRLKLQDRFSPEQIAGLLRTERGRPVISHETIVITSLTAGLDKFIFFVICLPVFFKNIQGYQSLP